MSKICCKLVKINFHRYSKIRILQHIEKLLFEMYYFSTFGRVSPIITKFLTKKSLCTYFWMYNVINGYFVMFIKLLTFLSKVSSYWIFPFNFLFLISFFSNLISVIKVCFKSTKKSKMCNLIGDFWVSACS